MKKVLLLSNIPSPYLTPLFNRLVRECNWKLEVCYVSAWSNNVGWSERTIEGYGISAEAVLDKRFPALSQFVPQLAAAFALLERIFQQQPDYLIIYGYTRIPQVTALLWCLLTQLPFAVAGDATYYADGAKGIRKFLKGCWLGLLSRYAAGIIVVGKASRMFWEAYGARRERIFEAPFAVDNEFFIAESGRRKPEAASFREQKGWQEKTIYLYVGRLIKRKNVDVLIRAMQQLKDKDIVVLIAGDGEERAALEALVAGDTRIRFVGTVGQEELPFYYALADVLVLPSRAEPWGLVINEAMACGLAVIAHQDCGATVDLVDETNGIRLATFQPAELSTALQRLSQDKNLLRAMQARSRSKIAGWSIAAAAQGIIRAVAAPGPNKATESASVDDPV